MSLKFNKKIFVCCISLVLLVFNNYTVFASVFKNVDGNLYINLGNNTYVRNDDAQEIIATYLNHYGVIPDEDLKDSDVLTSIDNTLRIAIASDKMVFDLVGNTISVTADFIGSFFGNDGVSNAKVAVFPGYDYSHYSADYVDKYSFHSNVKQTIYLSAFYYDKDGKKVYPTISGSMAYYLEPGDYTLRFGFDSFTSAYGVSPSANTRLINFKDKIDGFVLTGNISFSSNSSNISDKIDVLKMPSIVSNGNGGYDYSSPPPSSYNVTNTYNTYTENNFVDSDDGTLGDNASNDNSYIDNLELPSENKPSSDASILDWLSYWVGGIVDFILSLLKMLLKVFVSLFDFLKSLVDITSDISSIWNLLFGFLPPPIPELVVLTFSCIIVISFIRFLK